eukprot:scaffold2036_cov51-Attheya_sp.AAC.4
MFTIKPCNSHLETGTNTGRLDSCRRGRLRLLLSLSSSDSRFISPSSFWREDSMKQLMPLTSPSDCKSRINMGVCDQNWGDRPNKNRSAPVNSFHPNFLSSSPARSTVSFILSHSTRTHSIQRGI